MSRRVLAAVPIFVAACILLLTAWVYWPGQTGPALLDDASSVLVISDLQEHPEKAWDYILGDRSGALGRPVSMASFVLERLFLDGSVATSKLVNILLHLFNGLLVVCLFWLLFRFTATPGYRWLAVVLGAMWLLSPLYVSTVLYVVQRMAMLCTTFMLCACISYVYWREKLLRGHFSFLLLGLLGLSLVLAVFAKENAVVVIPVLLLLEALWYQFRDERGEPIRWLQSATLVLIGLGAVAVIAALVLNYEGLAAAFRHRYFTLDERLLTQSRILWDYVGQLYGPDVARMGIYHDDVVVSKTLNTPPATFYAVAAWLAVAVLGLVSLYWRWGRYLCFGVAWFLVGHSIEASVFSLELYFEHRNYFPGIGLLLLLGVVFSCVVKRWPEVKSPLLVYFACYALWLATLTGSQVQIWSSHPLLILNNLNAHPNSFRANADMAVQMANVGAFEEAQKYSAKAFSVSAAGERSGDHDIRDIALACIANQPVEPGRIARLGLENAERPFGSVVTLHTMVHLLQDNACPDFDRVLFADRMAEIFLAAGSSATASPNIYTGLAVLENNLQRWQQANAYMDLFLNLRPDNAQGLLMKLHFVTALGKVESVEAVTSQLLALQKQGKLTVGEQQNLALYLEK